MNFFNPVKIKMYPRAASDLFNTSRDLNLLIFVSRRMLKDLKNDLEFLNLLKLNNVLFEHDFTSNPALDDLVKITERLFDRKIDVIWGIGGGSAMDVAKIASVTLPSRRLNFSLANLLEEPNILDEVSPIDCVQIPTTAGTGSEVTPFATIWDYDKQLKKSLSHIHMFSKKAVIDSRFLAEVPADIALSSGLDALNQALESLWNVNANALTRSISVRAVISTLNGLRNLSDLSEDGAIADQLATGSLLAGLAISQTRTALCHSISYPLTLKFNIPHGLACAFTMLEVLDFNASCINDEIKTIECELGDKGLKTTITKLFEKYGFYSIIQKYIVSIPDVLDLLPEMVTPGRSDNNIKSFSNDDLEQIVTKSCLNASIPES